MPALRVRQHPRRDAPARTVAMKNNNGHIPPHFYTSPENGRIALPEYEYRLVALDSVVVDHADTSDSGVVGYQRKVKSKVQRMISDGYKPSALGAPILAERRDGRLHCEDGQQRITWLMDQGVQWFWCLVCKSSGQVEEAETFVKINGGRQAVTPLEIFHAEVAAGNHDARCVQSAMHAQGFWMQGGVHPSNGMTDGGPLTCIKAVKFAYFLGGRSLLEDTLSIIASAWIDADQKRSRSEIFVKGIAYFLAGYSHYGVDPMELSNRLHGNDATLLESKAIQWNRENGINFGGSRWFGMAAQVHRIWNFKRTARRLPTFQKPNTSKLASSRYQRPAGAPELSSLARG